MQWGSVTLTPLPHASFRDELLRLFPGEERAEQLSKQMLFFSELIERRRPGEQLSTSATSALVQIHCHHHAVIETEAERKLLDRLGVHYEIMASGCCGMAGSFGFETAKYEMSMAAAERVMLPKIRQTPGDHLILANGFSCREQIEQATQRPTVHVAELMAKELCRPIG